MNRYFKMTEKAQQALWSKLSNNENQIPSQFLVEGDAKEGYSIYYVNDELCGVNLLPNYTRIRSFYAVKRLIEDINTNGKPLHYAALVDMRCFAWANYPAPVQ